MSGSLLLMLLLSQQKAKPDLQGTGDKLLCGKQIRKLQRLAGEVTQTEDIPPALSTVTTSRQSGWRDTNAHMQH